MQHGSRLAGFLACAAIVLFALNRTHNLPSFFDPFQALLVLGLVLAGLWAGYGHRLLLGSLACALSGHASSDARENEQMVALLARGYRLSWASGLLASVIGVLLALSALESPAELGSALAVSGLGLFYGALLAELCFANLHSWIRREPALTR